MLFDFAALTADNVYKLLVSTVVPRPIAWVTTLDTEGRVNAAPYSFFNVMGNDPPVVCIGIGPKKGDLKDTGTNIRRTGQFVVNLVSEDTVQAMNITAIDVDPGVDELAMAKLTPLASTTIDPPRIAESPVALECERLAVVELGNGRAVVMGKVLAMHVRDDCVLDPAKCYIDTPRLGLIGRMHGRGWYARTTDRIEIPRISVAEWQAGKAAE
jgi:flavin reductase (DIM6/NTAB) family NADH-FMN oxidoreductase RutF